MENKSEIEKHINNFIRNKLDCYLQCCIFSLCKLYYSQKKTTMKGIRSIQDMIYFETSL